MLVVTRYRVAPGDQEAFRADAAAALRVLSARPGCAGATVGRAVDDPHLWTLTSSWESVGAYRRALSCYEVKLVAVPLMYRALDEPSAFEPLVTWTPAGGFAEHEGALTGEQSPGPEDPGPEDPGPEDPGPEDPASPSHAGGAAPDERYG